LQDEHPVPPVAARKEFPAKPGFLSCVLQGFFNLLLVVLAKRLLRRLPNSDLSGSLKVLCSKAFSSRRSLSRAQADRHIGIESILPIRF